MCDRHLDELFFNALRHSISGESLWESEFISLSVQEWQSLYRLSAQQGVLAVIFDAIEGVKQYIPRNIKIQWALSVEQIEKRYFKQEKLANEISAIWATHNIDTVVLKGLAVSQYYPIPHHRECGDFDCILLGKFEKGNRIAKEYGAEVRFDDYKHSHITYKGLMIENHKYCTPIRGSRINKKLEKYLIHLLQSRPFEYLSDSSLISPSATFNALFLVRHSLTHFLYEGINIRHLIDWAYLLKYQQHNIMWDDVYRWCKKMNMTRFIDLMNGFVHNYFGVEITNPRIQLRDKELDKVVSNILYDENSVYNRPDLSLWQQRWAILKNMFSNHWKYHQIYQKSLILECVRALYGIVFEKKPKL